MTAQSTKPGEGARVMTFPAASGALYGLAPGVKHGDVVDQLTARMAQLEALLSVTYGEQGRAFRGMSDELQDSFMWASSSLADEAHQLSKIALSVAQEGEA